MPFPSSLVPVLGGEALLVSLPATEHLPWRSMIPLVSFPRRETSEVIVYIHLTESLRINRLPSCLSRDGYRRSWPPRGMDADVGLMDLAEAITVEGTLGGWWYLPRTLCA